MDDPYFSSRTSPRKRNHLRIQRSDTMSRCQDEDRLPGLIAFCIQQKEKGKQSKYSEKNLRNPRKGTSESRECKDCCDYSKQKEYECGGIHNLCLRSRPGIYTRRKPRSGRQFS